MSDYGTLVDRYSGGPTEIGDPVDSSEDGPLGPLWPHGEPEWYRKRLWSMKITHPTVLVVRSEDDLETQLEQEVAKADLDDRNDFICLDLEDASIDEKTVSSWVERAFDVIDRRALADPEPYAPRVTVRAHEFSDDLKDRLTSKGVVVLDTRLIEGDAESMLHTILHKEQKTLENISFAEAVAPFRPISKEQKSLQPTRVPTPFDVLPAHADPQLFADWIESLGRDSSAG